MPHNYIQKVPNQFFKNLVNKYRKTPYLSENEVAEFESYLKKYGIKKNEACLLIDVKYKALNKKQKKKQLPRVLLDFFRLGESAAKLEKVEEGLK